MPTFDLRASLKVKRAREAENLGTSEANNNSFMTVYNGCIYLCRHITPVIARYRICMQ